MFDATALLLISLTFLVAGSVKGIIGLGLPSVVLALLTATIGLQPAMALLLVPSAVTNLWQAAAGGNTRVIVKRIWPFLLAATVTVWIGALALADANIALLSALLGALLVLYSVINLIGLRVSIPRRWEGWAGPIVGVTNGVLTGMTGSFFFPGVLYLQAIGLSRDMLIQAMGILFTVSTIALAMALGGQRLLTAELGVISAAAVLPALIGMLIGQGLRKRLSEAKFRRVFFTSLLVVGFYIITGSLGR